LWIVWVDESRWLDHVYIFGEEVMKECILNIYLFEGPTCKISNI